jgi:hypothetical protein
MRLPILIHGKPSVLKNAARVALGDGRWKIVHDVIDSKISIVRYIPSVSLNNTAYVPESHQLKEGLILEGNCVVHVHVDEAGTERAISLYAELVK